MSALDDAVETLDCSIADRVLSKHDEPCLYHSARSELVALRVELQERDSIIEQLRTHGGDWIVEGASKEIEALRVELQAARDESARDWQAEKATAWAKRCYKAESALQAAQELARAARNHAAAPDYDEEAIRDVLWALVRAVLVEGAR